MLRAANRRLSLPPQENVSLHTGRLPVSTQEHVFSYAVRCLCPLGGCVLTHQESARVHSGGCVLHTETTLWSWIEAQA